MRLSILLLLSFVTILIQAHAQTRCCSNRPDLSCKTFMTRLRADYLYYVVTMRRNAPETLAGGFLKYRVITLTAWMRKNCDCGNGEDTVSKACFSEHEWEDYLDTVPFEPSIDEIIQDMRIKDKDLFYIASCANPDQQHYPHSRIFPMDLYQENFLEKAWNKTSRVGKMKTTTKPELLEDMVSVPPGVKIFYEPSPETKCQTFNRFTNFDRGLISATRFMSDIIRMTTLMHLCGVKSEYYLQILRHGTAYLYSGMRCKREERSKLKVSRIFYPWYRQIVKEFTPKECRTKIKNVKNRIINRNLQWYVKQLSSHHCWGRIHCFNFINRTVHLYDVGKEIFADENMDNVRIDLNLPPGYIYGRKQVCCGYQGQSTDRAVITSSRNRTKTQHLIRIPHSINETILQIGSWTRKSQLDILDVVRGDMDDNDEDDNSNCDDGYYEHENGVCCGLMCKCTSLLAIAGSLTESQCCFLCNSNGCGDNILFKKLAAFPVDPYGAVKKIIQLQVRVNI